MNDHQKTKAELISELEALRARLFHTNSEPITHHLLQDKSQEPVETRRGAAMPEATNTQKQEEQQAEKNSEAQAGQASPVLVLMLEDTPLERLIYRKYLELDQRYCYEIVEFGTGAEALCWCQTHRPDVMLIDYYLPDMNGLEFLQQLQQQSGQDRLPAIAITGQNQTEVAVNFLKTGAEDYLDKNQISAEILHRAIANILQQTELIKTQQWHQQRQQLLSTTALQIRQSLNLTEILSTTVTEVRNILNCDRVIIHALESNGGGLVVTESVVDPAFSILGWQIRDDCFSQSYVEPYRKGRTSTIDDVAAQPHLADCYRDFLIQFQIKANLVVPILLHNDLWGLLVAHHCTAPRYWASVEVELMKELATHVGIAIQQATLVKQLQTELTQRRRTEARLQQSEEKFRQLAENIQDVFFLYTADYRELLYINPAYETLWQQPKESLYLDPTSFLETIHPEDQARINSAMQCLINGEEAFRQEYRILRPDGSQRWIYARTFYVYNEVGEVYRIAGLASDITERKQSELTLQEQEETLRLLIQSAPAGIAMFDRNMRYLMVSQRWVEDYQLSSMESLIGRSHYDIFPEIPQTWRQIHQNCLTGAVAQLEEDLFTRLDGTQQWLRWEIRPWYNTAQEIGGIIIFSEDITHRKQAEIAHHQLNLELEQRIIERTYDLTQVNFRLQQELVEREKLERELRKREKLLDGFFNAATDANVGLSIVDRNFCYLKINQRLADMNGYPMEFHPGKRLTELLPEIGAKILPLLQRIIDTGEPISNWEVSGRVPSQPEVLQYWLVSYFPIFSETGHAIAVGSIVVEISDRKRIELEREKLIEILEATSDIIGSARLDTQQIEYINQAGRRFFGVGEEQPIDLQITNCHPEWALSIIRDQGLQTVLRDGIWIGETAFLSPDQQEIPISQVLIAHSFGTDQVKSISTIARDITTQKQTEAILRESERRWRSLLDNVQLIVIGLDQDGYVEYANPFFLQLTGYDQSDVLGKPWLTTFIPTYLQSMIYKDWLEVLTQEKHLHHQNPIVIRTGEERMIAWTNTVLRDMAGQVIGTMSIGEDITERYHLERMKAEFISVVSHELRTPLTSMQAALSLLHHKIIDPTSPEGEVTISIAADGVERLVRLVNDILDLERLESGKIRLEKRLCHLGDLINTALGQMQELANQENIILEENYPAMQVVVDPDRLLQVLINLLSNAIKFSPTGSTIKLTVEQLLDPMPCVQFTVADQGRGIPADKLESIFERFQQVDASDSREKNGTGLGLAICRSIIQQHGGKIWVESKLGKGSIFYVTIPIAMEDEHDREARVDCG